MFLEVGVNPLALEKLFPPRASRKRAHDAVGGTDKDGMLRDAPRAYSPAEKSAAAVLDWPGGNPGFVRVLLGGDVGEERGEPGGAIGGYQGIRHHA